MKKMEKTDTKAEHMTNPDQEVLLMEVIVSVEELCRCYNVGSDDWSWDQEAEWIYDENAEKMDRLREDIASNGQKEPVLLGSDGRVWDGHHRITIMRESNGYVRALVPVSHDVGSTPADFKQNG
jgi:predicted unusual protein kinase regulating ubiquinone biosynthesis (AarF/ABC1/UbiB family)